MGTIMSTVEMKSRTLHRSDSSGQRGSTVGGDDVEQPVQGIMGEGL